MNEFEKRLAGVLTAFNDTFELNVQFTGDQEEKTEEPVDDKKGKKKTAKKKVAEEKPAEEKQTDVDDTERMVTRVAITKLKGSSDGADFVESFCSLFGPLVEQMSGGEKALVYEEEHGLAIRRVDED